MTLSAIYETIWAEPSVTMLTASNASPLTLEGTNSYIVGISPAFVIDPGPVSDQHTAAIAETLRAIGANVVGILLTHGHPDHAPGARELSAMLGVPVWASPHMQTAYSGPAGVTEQFSAHQQFQVNSDRLLVIDSPGHSADHVTYWLEGARILFAGDAVLGQGSTLIAPPEGDMWEYMRTLQRLRALWPRLIAPGHGPLVRDPLAKFDEYILHRQQREAQVIDALRAGDKSVREIVTHVYSDVPGALHEFAIGSVQAQLRKLERERRVRRSGAYYTLVS